MPAVSAQTSISSHLALTAAEFRAPGYEHYPQYTLRAQCYLFDPLGGGAYLEFACGVR